MLLANGRDGSWCVTATRVRLRDRLAVRVRAFALDWALAQGADPDRSVALELRAEQLISTKVRDEIGRDVLWLLSWARRRQRRPIHAVPLSARMVRGVEPELAALAARLLDARPVDPRGVASARTLLCDGCSPLYQPYGSDPQRLRDAVNATIDALDLTG